MGGERKKREKRKREESGYRGKREGKREERERLIESRKARTMEESYLPAYEDFRVAVTVFRSVILEPPWCDRSVRPEPLLPDALWFPGWPPVLLLQVHESTHTASPLTWLAGP